MKNRTKGNCQKKKNQKVFLLQKNSDESAALCSKRLGIRLLNPTIITSIEKNGEGSSLLRYWVSFIFIFGRNFESKDARIIRFDFKIETKWIEIDGYKMKAMQNVFHLCLLYNKLTHFLDKARGWPSKK